MPVVASARLLPSPAASPSCPLVWAPRVAVTASVVALHVPHPSLPDVGHPLIDPAPEVQEDDDTDGWPTWFAPVLGSGVGTVATAGALAVDAANGGRGRRGTGVLRSPSDELEREPPEATPPELLVPGPVRAPRTPPTEAPSSPAVPTPPSGTGMTQPPADPPVDAPIVAQPAPTSPSLPSPPRVGSTSAPAPFDDRGEPPSVSRPPTETPRDDTRPPSLREIDPPDPTTSTVVPEPASLGLVLAGAAMLSVMAWLLGRRG